MRKQRGVALIQVIIITSIILLLTIFFLSVAKSQVARAAALQAKSLAYMAQYSGKNRVLFGLLTKDSMQLREQGWNFYGQAFSINEHTKVQLQDLNGLFSFITMTEATMLERLLQQYLENKQATTIANSVMDWIDSDSVRRANGAEQNDYPAGITVRNARIQTFTELVYINGMSVEAEQALIANTTFQPTPFFNPMTAPEPVLAIYTQDSNKASEVIALQQTINFNRKEVRDLSGLESDESIMYFIGPGYRITLTAQVENSYVGKIFEYGIFPYDIFPVESLSNIPKQR
ncbi:type II secretion system protein GspK [uncultured Paraglaciecola sp.]|mgnify:FL=1|jgi:general secretion pathway protein K|uniref:type II secretion system protein GspK n=1 Tax=uncultured Paraglaciecola sp. TaxID=1765024 RepID=UPI00261103D8|nr:type II secretion system protein GspK [uncultured Paraglaciecola sp.]